MRNTPAISAAEMVVERTAPAPQKTATCDVRVHDNLASVQSIWHRLEQISGGTAYQSYAFCKAWFETIGAADGIAPMIVHIADASRGIELIWPFAVSRKAGCRVVHFAGGKHSNYNLPLGLFAKLEGAELRELLLDAARMAGIDLIKLKDQPHVWQGLSHPLASLAHTASPSSAWNTDLIGDPDAAKARIMSAESLKKMRTKERKLAELGPVTYGVASTQGEIDAALEAFLSHKKIRFAAMGVPNPFADTAVVDFLRHLTLAPKASSSSPAPMQFHTLKVGGTIAALFGGMTRNGRFHGMVTSFNGDPAIAKYGPGDLLLLNMISTMGTQGLTCFDLGIGDAAYKTAYCPNEDKLFDSCMSVTTKGAILCSTLTMLTRLKRYVKAHPSLLSFARKFQRH